MSTTGTQTLSSIVIVLLHRLKKWDIGVDNNDFYPVSFNKICEIMVDRPDNPNFVKNNAA